MFAPASRLFPQTGVEKAGSPRATSVGVGMKYDVLSLSGPVAAYVMSALCILMTHSWGAYVSILELWSGAVKVQLDARLGINAMLLKNKEFHICLPGIFCCRQPL